MTDDIKIREDAPKPARLNRRLISVAILIVFCVAILLVSHSLRSKDSTIALPEDRDSSTDNSLPPGMTATDYSEFLKRKGRAEDSGAQEGEKVHSQSQAIPKFLQKDSAGNQYAKIPPKDQGATTISVSPVIVSELPEVEILTRKLDLLAEKLAQQQRLGNTHLPRAGVGPATSSNTNVMLQDEIQKRALTSPIQFRSNSQSGGKPNPIVREMPAHSSAASVPVSLPSRGGVGMLDETAQQAMQSQKQQFVSRLSATQDTAYLFSEMQQPKSPYEIKAGSIIPVTLFTGINSDLPGRIIAQVRNTVYDTVTGNHVLIPQGSRIIGEYDSVVAYGQERVLLAFSRIIFPNGNSINLEGMPGIDLSGYAGLSDKVNHHYVRLLTGVLLSALVSASAQETDDAEVFLRSAAAQTQDIGEKIAEKNLNIQPTITIRPGWSFNVFVHKDMILEPYSE